MQLNRLEYEGTYIYYTLQALTFPLGFLLHCFHRQIFPLLPINVTSGTRRLLFGNDSEGARS